MDADGLVVADYGSPDVIVGAGAQLEAKELTILAPGIPVVTFAGVVDAPALERVGVRCVPGEMGRPGRMGRTLAYLGPRPVVDLHCAGLKVAERLVKERAAGLSETNLPERIGPLGQQVVGGG